MNPKYRKTIIAGNWKMNMLVSDVKPFVEELKGYIPKTKTCEAVLCVPAVNIAAMLKLGKEARIVCGAQDVSKYDKGAYTGEISASQLPVLNTALSAIPSAANIITRAICSSTQKPAP